MEVNAPSKLKSKLRFYPINQIGETTWGILKAKLTGKKSKFGHFYSEVNLSESDVDKLIENIKKSGEYPNLEDESDNNSEIYQNWLVDTYLKSAPTESKSNGDSDKEKKNENVKVESKKDSAPPLYEGVRETDLVNEEIDERILEILGLKEVYDFTYGEYKQLLFTELQKIDRGEEKSTDRAMLLQDEFKRVKGKVGRFKIKSKKLTLDNIVARGPIRVDKNKFLLADKVKAVDAPEAKEGTDSKSIVLIEKTLDNIIGILQKQDSERKKALEKDRQSKERESRKRKESLLEKSLGAIKTATQKILAPVQSIWDRIVNYLSNVILGFAATKLFDWLTDPKNKDKIQVIGRFLKDWWPALLGAFVLFATPFGKFIRGTIGLLRALLPRLINLIRLNPFTAAGLAAVGLAAAANEVTGQRKAAPIQAQQQAKVDRGKALSVQGADTMADKTPSVGNLRPALPTGALQGVNGGGLIKKRSFFGGGQVDREVDVRDIAFAGGGGITDESGLRVKGAGPDTQLIAAAPGEVVMSKKAVDKYGANFFLGLNKNAGGTNIPKMVNNIQLAQGGGIVKKQIQTFQGGGMVGDGTKPPTPNVGTNIMGMFGSAANSIRGLFGGGTTKSSQSSKSKSKPLPLPEYKNPLVKAALRTLKFTEGTDLNKNPYDTVYGGGTMPVTKMTVNELINTQMTDILPKRFGATRAPWPSGSVASGAYQFMPDTLKQLIKIKVLKPTDIMTSDNQDRAAWELMKNRGVTINTLKRSGFNRTTQNLLSGEWASVPTLSGKSAYDQPVKPSAKIEDYFRKSLNSPNITPSSRRVSVINLPPQIEKVAMNPMRNAPAGTGVPSLSAEDPNFPYSASRAFYQGLTDLPVA